MCFAWLNLRSSPLENQLGTICNANCQFALQIRPLALLAKASSEGIDIDEDQSV
jgi:hypothetical protein